MISKVAVIDTVKRSCRNIDYDITYSLTTNSIYVRIYYGNDSVCLRISDHVGKNAKLKWYDYSEKNANCKDLEKFIQSRIKTVRYVYKRKCFDAIA